MISEPTTDTLSTSVTFIYRPVVNIDSVQAVWSGFHKNSSYAPLLLPETSSEFSVAVERPSMFVPHQLQQKHFSEISQVKEDRSWFFGLLLLGFVLYAWIFSSGIQRVIQLVSASFQTRSYNKLTREGNLFGERSFFPLLFLIVLCLSLFFFRIGTEYGFQHFSDKEQWNLFGKCFLGICIILILKILFIRISAWLFKEQAAGANYLSLLFIFDSCMALTFLPLLLASFFGDLWLQKITLYIMIFIIVTGFIFRFFRLVLLGINTTKFSFVHNFLYFCTLEILFSLFWLRFAISGFIF